LNVKLLVYEVTSRLEMVKHHVKFWNVKPGLRETTGRLEVVKQAGQA